MPKDKIRQLYKARAASNKLTAYIEMTLCGLESDDTASEQKNIKDLHDSFDSVLREMLVLLPLLKRG